MKRLALIATRLSVAGAVCWALVACTGARDVSFVRASREALVSTVQTNGKVEPTEWVAVRAGRAGAVTAVGVKEGEHLARGTMIAELEADSARADLAAARARYDQARSELDLLDEGGRPSDLATIESSLASASLELDNARSQVAALKRLADRNAATGQELRLAEERVRKAELEISSVEKKRDTLVSPAERGDAEARLRAAESDAEQAERRLTRAIARSPMEGVVYNLAVRKGSFVQPGDLLAEIGRLEELRVVIYVDEPELGRIQVGMPVVITWDALPGREWDGVVERLPSQIVQLDTRQVGEVIGLVENPDLALPAHANINAELRTEVSEDAITIPKQALHRRDGHSGVYVLNGEGVEWRPVKLGSANVTHVEVLDGISEGDAVALPAEPPLTDGEQVSPVLR